MQKTIEERTAVEQRRRGLLAQLYRDSGVAKVAAVGKFLKEFLLPPVSDDAVSGALSSVSSAPRAAARPHSAAALPPVTAATRKRAVFIVDSDSECDVVAEDTDIVISTDDDALPAAAKRARGGSTKAAVAPPRRRKAAADDDDDDCEILPTLCAACGAKLIVAGGSCEACDELAFARSLEACAVPAGAPRPPIPGVIDLSQDDLCLPPLEKPIAIEGGLPPGMARTEKIVIFGHHRDVLDGLEAWVRSHGYKCIR